MSLCVCLLQTPILLQGEEFGEGTLFCDAGTLPAAAHGEQEPGAVTMASGDERFPQGDPPKRMSQKRLDHGFLLTSEELVEMAARNRVQLPSDHL